MRVRISDEERKERHRIGNRAWHSANKESANKRRAEWRKNNPEKTKLYNKTYQRLNPEKQREYRKNWEKRNPEKGKEWDKRNRKRLNEINKKWREDNKDKSNASSAKYRKNNPEVKRLSDRNRRAKKNNCEGVLSKDISSRLLILQKYRCSICRKSLKKTGYHLDHIIPLSRGGKNEDRNMQVACPTCNMKKHAKDPIQYMQSLGYLL